MPDRRWAGHAVPLGGASLAKLVMRTIAADARYRTWRRRPLSYRRLAASLTPTVQRPILIIGSPRSGTTLLGRCLAESAEISYHFEPALAKVAARQVFEETWARADSARFYRALYAGLLLINLDGDLRLAEKTPQNCFAMELLADAFEDGQFVHIIRDGRDVALSWSEQPWLQAALAGSGKKEPGGHPYGPYARFWVERERIGEFESTSDLHRCAWGWRRHVEAAQRTGTSLGPGRYHEVRYEDLVADGKKVATELADFLELEHDDGRKRFLGMAAAAESGSVGRWQRSLSAIQLDEVEREAGPLLRRLGYVDGSEAARCSPSL